MFKADVLKMPVDRAGRKIGLYS